MKKNVKIIVAVLSLIAIIAIVSIAVIIHNSSSIEAMYIRGEHEVALDEPKVEMLKSYDELKDYYDTNKETYLLTNVRKLISGVKYEEGDFLQFCEKYDEDYFKDKSLAIVYITEGSGSIRHKVTDIKGHIIEVERISTKSGLVTDDIANWRIVVEVHKDIDVTEVKIIK